jgi:hypothetical protein
MGIGLSQEELALEISWAYDEGVESAAVLCLIMFPRTDKNYMVGQLCAAKIRGLKENK